MESDLKTANSLLTITLTESDLKMANSLLTTAWLWCRMKKKTANPTTTVARIKPITMPEI